MTEFNTNTVYDSLMPVTNDGVCVTNASGKILETNLAGADILGRHNLKRRGGKLCSLLCGRMMDRYARPCVWGCSLRAIDSEKKSITLEGRYTAGVSSRGKQAEEKMLRVRCQKIMPGESPSVNEERHLVFIEEIKEGKNQKKNNRDSEILKEEIRFPAYKVEACLKMLETPPQRAGYNTRETLFLRQTLNSCQRALGMVRYYLNNKV